MSTQPTAYGFHHLHMPYRVKKFDTEQRAKAWSVRHGYKMDGTLSDSLYQAAQEQGDTAQLRTKCKYS